mmetsp:Transcript_101883/g.263298  ORF Transcript_101883/g.263298 Transcript_101883/m.263298 type:complete len:672 (+) Transcript_101883:82-2097(+)
MSEPSAYSHFALSSSVKAKEVPHGEDVTWRVLRCDARQQGRGGHSRELQLDGLLMVEAQAEVQSTIANRMMTDDEQCASGPHRRGFTFGLAVLGLAAVSLLVLVVQQRSGSQGKRLAGGSGAIALNTACHTAVKGESCYDGVIWAMEHGIRDNPSRYQGLTKRSDFVEFQALLHRNGSHEDCGQPCGTAEVAAEDACHTAVLGEACYDGVIWARKDGVRKHPGWFKGLTSESSFEKFQAVLHRTRTEGCPRPCGKDGEELPATIASTQTSTSTRTTALTHTVTETTTTTQAPTQPPSIEPCNLQMTVPWAESQKWEVSAEMSDYCFKMVALSAPELTAGGSFGRNWCWVGFKEFGCHKNLWDPWTWAEEHQKAIEAQATIPSDFQPLQDPHVCDRRENGQAPSWGLSDWDEAMSWFRANVAVYVLTLPQSEERKTTITKRLNQLDIPFTFVWGVDMRQPTAFQDAVAEGLIPDSYDVKKAQEEAGKAKNDMNRFGSIMGTVGCAAGHFRAQRRALTDSPSRPLTVVLEDDVSPEEDFVPRLWSMVKTELPCDWQAVSLSSRCPFGKCVTQHLTRVLPDVNEPAWRCRHGVNYGFQGMLYRTHEIENLQRIWRPVVFDMERPHCLDVDVALASISDQVSFYAVPSVQVPGFLKELRQGSSRVDINWQQVNAK